MDKKVKMAGDCGLNALSLPAGKCAGPIPAENRTLCGKSIQTQVLYVIVITKKDEKTKRTKNEEMDKRTIRVNSCDSCSKTTKIIINGNS